MMVESVLDAFNGKFFFIVHNGIGQTAVAAGLQSDVPLFLGIVLFSAVFVFVGNLLADLSYYLIDPRIKESEFSD
jgi:peptide/nickel transport system permease protein